MIFMNSRNRKCTVVSVFGGIKTSTLIFSKIPYGDYINHAYNLTMINCQVSGRGLFKLNKSSNSRPLGFKDD